MAMVRRHLQRPPVGSGKRPVTSMPAPVKGKDVPTPPAPVKGRGVPTPPAPVKGRGVPTPPAPVKGRGVPTPRGGVKGLPEIGPPVLYPRRMRGGGMAKKDKK